MFLNKDFIVNLIDSEGSHSHYERVLILLRYTVCWIMRILLCIYYDIIVIYKGVGHYNTDVIYVIVKYKIVNSWDTSDVKEYIIRVRATEVVVLTITLWNN